MPSMAWRRHHDARIKQKVKHYFVCEEHDYVIIDGRQYLVRGPHPTEDPARLGKMAGTPKPCSHPWCCGNPRRFTGQRTVQERRQGWR